MKMNNYLIPMAAFLAQAQVLAQDTEQYCRKYLRDLENQRASLHANPGYRSYAPAYKAMPGRSNVDAAQVLKSLQEHLIAHHQNCQNRQDCMRADLATIDKFRDDHHEAVDIINRFKAELKKHFEADVLPTELTVYQQLSPAGQQLYNSGIILTWPQQTPVNNQKQQQPLYYNLDEMLIAVLQQLNKAHQTCNNRQACLQQDVQLLASLQQKYSQDQRFVNQLDSLIQLINQANNQDIFATPQFLNGYVAHLRANQPMRYVSKVAEDFEMIKSKVALSAKVRAVQLDESKHKPKSARDEARDNLKATGKEMLGSLVGQTSEAGSVAAGEVKPKKLIGGLLGKLLGF